MDLHAETGIKPVPPLTTARLTLRGFRRSDAPVVLEALNDWSVTQWLTRVPFPYAQQDFDWFLSEMCNAPDDNVWAMEADGQMIGAISNGTELGYWLAPAHRGKGYMTEAARCVCSWHFANSDDALRSGYHLGNAASRNVLSKLGFTDTHIDRAVETARGDTVDIQRNTLPRAQWRG